MSTAKFRTDSVNNRLKCYDALLQLLLYCSRVWCFVNLLQRAGHLSSWTCILRLTKRFYFSAFDCFLAFLLISNVSDGTFVLRQDSQAEDSVLRLFVRFALLKIPWGPTFWVWPAWMARCWLYLYRAGKLFLKLCLLLIFIHSFFTSQVQPGIYFKIRLLVVHDLDWLVNLVRALKIDKSSLFCGLIAHARSQLGCLLRLLSTLV